MEELRLNGVEDVKSIWVELLVTWVSQGSYREWGEIEQVGEEGKGDNCQRRADDELGSAQVTPAQQKERDVADQHHQADRPDEGDGDKEK